MKFFCPECEAAGVTADPERGIKDKINNSGDFSGIVLSATERTRSAEAPYAKRCMNG
ncbi:MAG: hypothetical protein MSH32_06750 [Lachnospiraceae bacterium]|nr:hypothetical protein [Lachnospiraceae bacterium]